MNRKDKKIILKERNTIIQVDIESITMIVCEGYLSTICFLNEKRISVSKLLKDFETELIPYGFFRVNRNTLVNLKHIYSFQNGCKRLITMVDGNKIIVSFRKISQFKKNFTSLSR
jgi:two-component system LytT family response regulator